MIEAFTPAVEFECPFCGRKAQAGHMADGDPAVIHEMPSCPDFERIDDPADYLAFVRWLYSPGGKS